VTFIKSKSAAWARRITEVRKVHVLVADPDLVVPPLKRLLARWWGPEADLQLLKAVAGTKKQNRKNLFFFFVWRKEIVLL
jgi:hypothetical protein